LIVFWNEDGPIKNAFKFLNTIPTNITNVLRHAVHLDVIHIFASHALENIEFDQADDRKLTKCLAKCTSKAKDDPKTNPISKIMTAINEKFPKLSNPILRLVMKKPEMLCR